MGCEPEILCIVRKVGEVGMTFPPPPGLSILAYQFGSITKQELICLIKLWNEKHKEEKP